MKWFRRNIQTGSRLALFALVVQFALSFGHFHWNAAQAAQAIQAGLTRADPAYAQDLVAADTESEAPKQHRPSPPDTDQQPADACAICAVIALAGNALFATPPLLLLPQAIELLYLATDAEFAHLNSGRSAFQSRAPPAS